MGNNIEADNHKVPRKIKMEPLAAFGLTSIQMIVLCIVMVIFAIIASQMPTGFSMLIAYTVLGIFFFVLYLLCRITNETEPGFLLYVVKYVKLRMTRKKRFTGRGNN